MEAVAAGAAPEVHQEVEGCLGIRDEGALGEEEEQEALVLGEGVEGEIRISQGRVIVAEDHRLSDLALRQKVLYL